MKKLLIRKSRILFIFLLLLLFFDTIIVRVLEQFFNYNFAFVPYYRVLIIIFSFSFFTIVFLKVRLKIAPYINNEKVIGLFWLSFTLIQLFHGIIVHNPIVYIIADTVYIFFGLYLFILISNSKLNLRISLEDIFWFIKRIMFFLMFFLLIKLPIAEVFFIVVLSLLFITYIYRKYQLSILLFLLFLFQVSSSNRALLICFLTIIIIIIIKKVMLSFAKVDRFILVCFILLSVVFFYGEFLVLLKGLVPKGSSIYYRIEQLYTIINEGIDFKDPSQISITQRIIEAKVVLSLWFENLWSFVFGCGLGAVIDGGLLIDESVTKTALLGAKNIHNIHLLPFALIHKYGVFGVLIFFSLLIDVYNSFKRVIKSYDPSIFWNLIYVLIFIYSIPAASFMWTTPVFWIAFGMKSLLNNNTNEEKSV